MSAVFYIIRFVLLLSFFVSFLTASSCLLYEQASHQPKRVLNFRWPVYKEFYPKIPYISSTFAESRKTRFHNGLDIAGIEKEIYPLEKGQVLYSHYGQDTPYRAERGSGNILILDHGEGWWSGYYHLSYDSESYREGNIQNPDDVVIGKIGNTGRSSGYHLHFYLSRDYGRKFLNPLAYLPSVQDPHPPQIMALLILVKGEVTRLPLLGSSSKKKYHMIRLTKNHPIAVEIKDPGTEKESTRGIYKLTWQINQNVKEHRHFKELVYKNGHWYMGTLSYEDVFQEQFYYLGFPHFSHGINTVKVKAEDYNSNVTEALFQIEIERQY